MPRRRTSPRGPALGRGSVLLAAVSLAAVAFLGPGLRSPGAASLAQPPGPAAALLQDRPNAAEALFFSDRIAARQLELGRRSLAADRIDDAVDFAVLAAGAGADSVLPDGTSVRAAAANLLEQAAAADRRTVELRLGGRAAEALAQAEPGDVQALAEAAVRFPGTAAGGRAAARAADLQLDLGRYHAAARLFDRLAARPSASVEERGRWGMKAAAAHLRAGDRTSALERVTGVAAPQRLAFLRNLFPQSAIVANDPSAALAALGEGTEKRDAEPLAWEWVGRLPGRALVRPDAPAPAAVNAVGGAAWSANLVDVLPTTGADGPGPEIASTVRRARAQNGESLWPAARPLALRFDPERPESGEPGLGEPESKDAAPWTIVYSTPAGVTAADAATGAVHWESGLMPDSEFYRITRAEEDPIVTDRGAGAAR